MTSTRPKIIHEIAEDALADSVDALDIVQDELVEASDSGMSDVDKGAVILASQLAVAQAQVYALQSIAASLIELTRKTPSRGHRGYAGPM